MRDGEHVPIIGGGLAGLACGVALAARGVRPLVLEGTPALGGRARSWDDATTGDRIDIGPHILMSGYRNMLRLLEMLGTVHAVQWQGRRTITFVEPPDAISLHTWPLPPPLHFLPDLLRIRRLTLRDLLSAAPAGWRALRLSDDALRSLDERDAESLLRSWGTSEAFLDWYWRTTCIAIMNVPLEQCSAAALLQFFRLLAGRSDVEIGLPGIGLGDLFVPGAVRAIEAAGGRVVTHARVANIDLTEEGVHGVRMDDGTAFRADRCVVALPPAELLDALPGALAASPWFARFTRFRPSPYVSVYLWFDRRLEGESFWANVWGPDTMFYDFYDLSRIRPDWATRPAVIACNLIWSDRAAHFADAQLVDIAWKEFAAHVPQAAQAQLRHATVHRIPMAIPAPHPGSEGLRPTTRTPIPGLLIAGDWIHTGLPCSMESAVRAGWCAAEAALADLGMPADIVSPIPEPQGFVRWLSRD